MGSNQSREDYLESIYVLRQQMGTCHSIDVAARLGFSKASISVAVAKLGREGYLIKEADGELVLTEKGEALAVKIWERHRFFRDFLISIGVDPDTAEEDACRMEHVVSEETFSRIRANVLAEEACRRCREEKRERGEQGECPA